MLWIVVGGESTSRARRRRRSLRERLRSEVWRHLTAQLISLFLAYFVSLVLAAVEALPPYDPGDPLRLEIIAPTVLAFFTFYGITYFLLTRFAWQGLSGLQLRNALLESMPPPRGIVRDLLIGTPAQLSTTAGMLSLGAVAFVAMQPGTPFAVLLISLGCVCGSWILVMTSFSVEYAREWARADGFIFPGEDKLVFSDFTYLAVQASTTYSTSDVATANRNARRLVTIQSITAFIFATVILAFLVAIVLNTVAE